MCRLFNSHQWLCCVVLYILYISMFVCIYVVSYKLCCSRNKWIELNYFIITKYCNTLECHDKMMLHKLMSKRMMKYPLPPPSPSPPKKYRYVYFYDFASRVSCCYLVSISLWRVIILQLLCNLVNTLLGWYSTDVLNNIFVTCLCISHFLKCYFEQWNSYFSNQWWLRPT